MIRFLKIVFLALVAIVLLGFAFANRDLVTVSFDPFASRDSAALSVDAPLFVVVIIATMLGVVAGACVTWLSQGRHRRRARQNRVEAEKWRAQAQALRTTRANEMSHSRLTNDA